MRKMSELQLTKLNVSLESQVKPQKQKKTKPLDYLRRKHWWESYPIVLVIIGNFKNIEST